MRRLSSHLTPCVVALSLCLGCAKSTVPAQAAPAPKPWSAQLAAAVSANLQPLEVTRDRARMLLQVRRTAALAVPLTVRVDLPPGVTMTVGRTYIELPPNTAATEFSEPVELTYTQLPALDAVMTVSGTAAGVSASTEARFRFGRSGNR